MKLFNPNSCLIIAHQIRTCLYKNFKMLFFNSAAYRSWAAYRREPISLQIAIRLRLKKQMVNFTEDAILNHFNETADLKRALVIDMTTPRPDRDSGSVDAVYQMKVLQELGYCVTFIPDDLAYTRKYAIALQHLGVECLYAQHIVSIERYIELVGKYYDLVVIAHVSCAVKHITSVREYCRKAKVLFNTVDLHYLREERQAKIEGTEMLARSAAHTKMLEYMVMEKSDATIVISEVEQQIILQERPEFRVVTIPYVREVHGCRLPYHQRRDILFIGGFLHTPNIDAVLHFTHAIWPIIQRALPGVHFHIAGSHMPNEVAVLAERPGIIIDGYVQDLAMSFDHCRLSVAPLRYGAGIKGKIGTSLCYGVPCVATPLAAEGMGLTDREELLIASDAESFAAATIEAYQDEVLWNRLSARGMAIMEKQFSFKQSVERYRTLIGSLAHP